MTLRRRFLVILLAVSLAPLVVLRAVELLAFSRLSGGVVDQARDAMLERTRDELTASLDAFSAELQGDAQIAELLVRLQRSAIEARLAEAAAPPDPDSPLREDPPRIFQPEDFNGPQPAVPGLADSLVHGRLANGPLANGQEDIIPSRVSFDAHLTSFLREPSDRARSLAEAMAGLTPEFSSLRQELDDYILWQYAAFADGVMISYPGAAMGNAASQDFDPTLRPWYRIISSPESVAWSPPILDLPTGRVVFTVSAGLAWPDGALAGVTALDIPVALVLNKQAIDASWGSQSRLLLVELRRTPNQPDAPVPVVVMDADRERVRPFPLPINDPTQVARLMADQRRGVFEARIDGNPAVIGFANLAPENARNASASYLFVAAPTGYIAAPIDAFAESVEQTSWGLAAGTGVVMLAIAAGSVFIALRTSTAVARPIQDVAHAARALAQGDFKPRTPANAKTREVRDLQRVFEDLGPKLEDRVKVREALNVAMEVQHSLLPHEVPDWPGLDVAGQSLYCDETGGDYYDFIELSCVDRARSAVVIGDVTGHGVAAALLMATARGILRSRAGHPGSLAELFDDMNRHLCGPNTGGRFMTLFFLLIEEQGKRLRYVSAGHDPAILYRPNEDRFEQLEGRDIPLGIEDTWSFRELAYPGDPAGAVAVMATDGVWEAFNPQGEMYGKDRLMHVVRQNGRRTAQEILDAIRHDVDDFAQGLPPRDDITVVVIRFLPEET
ncbi:MAG: SpoIIE family protein phosphatase [Planctomycetota bacterium]